MEKSRRRQKEEKKRRKSWIYIWGRLWEDAVAGVRKNVRTRYCVSWKRKEKRLTIYTENGTVTEQNQYSFNKVVCTWAKFDTSISPSLKDSTSDSLDQQILLSTFAVPNRKQWKGYNIPLNSIYSAAREWEIWIIYNVSGIVLCFWHPFTFDS